jgi:hypothetical protein
MRCHSEPFAVILSTAKDLALGAQDKLREESCTAVMRIVEARTRARFLAALGMTGLGEVAA